MKVIKNVISLLYLSQRSQYFYQQNTTLATILNKSVLDQTYLIFS